MQIAAALPAGAVPARSQQQWLSAVDDALDADPLRADADANLRAIARVLALHAAWRSPMFSRPTWDLLAGRTSLSRRTVCNHLRWLREHQLLLIWQTGRTALFVPMALVGTQSNQAAEYLLLTPPPPQDAPPPAQAPPPGRPATPPPTPEPRAEPPRLEAVDKTCAPMWSRRDLENNPHAREAHDPQGRWRGAGNPARNRKPQRRWHDPALAARFALADRLRAHCRALHRLSTWHVASLIRGHVAAGWEFRDFIWALDHDQTGRAHWQTNRVHSPAGWFRRRLDLWRDAAGAPVLSPTRAAESARWREKARAARDAQDRPSRSGPNTGAAARTALRLVLARRQGGPGREPPSPDTA